MRRLRSPPWLDPRPPDAHKASVGKVLVVGGSRDLCGAPALAALGALRAGAGLVRIAVPRSLQGVVAGLRAEATTAGLPDTPDGGLAREAAGAAAALVPEWDALVLGPGAGRAEETMEAVVALALAAERPLVLDADGLHAFRGAPERLRGRPAATVLTPHEGEAARLLGVGSDRVRADREDAARALAAASGAVVVLKGPGTLVVDGTRRYRCLRGGPHLASGGTGDVLAGVVGAFLAGLPATGGDAFGAASAAVFVHAAAGDRAARGRDRGILASDLAALLPDTVAARVRAGRGTR